LTDLFADEKFDYVTACDVLEHIRLKEATKALQDVYSLLTKEGRLIFTAPGIFDKVKITIGKSSTHEHAHSSYGWMQIIRRGGFHIINVETVEFPLVHSNFLRKKLHIFASVALSLLRNMR